MNKIREQIEKFKSLFKGYLWEIAKPKVAASGGKYVATIAATWAAGPEVAKGVAYFCENVWPLFINLTVIMGLKTNLPSQLIVTIDGAAFYIFVAGLIHLLVSFGHDGLGVALKNIKAGKQMEAPQS